MKIKNCFSSRYGKLKKSWHHTGQVYPVHRFAYSAEPIYQRTIPFFCWILHRNIGIFLQKIKAHNNLFENASKLHLFISNDFINWFFIKQRRNLIVQNNNGFFVAKNMMIIISKISVFVCVCILTNWQVESCVLEHEKIKILFAYTANTQRYAQK